MSQRALQTSARRLAMGRPTPSLALARFASPSTSLISKRAASIASDKATVSNQSEGMTILENQRLQRPVSPHLTIYKPQLTWTLSIFNRMTGLVLSGGLYVFGAAYLVAPVFGWQITTAAMAAGFAKWPLILKLATKATLAVPFAFHSFNGIRHLFWDVGSQLSNQQVIRTGQLVIGLTLLTTAGLLFV